MKTYSLADVHIIWGNIAITGTADDAVTIETNEDLYTLQRGGDGKDFTRVRNNDLSARITVRVKQGSAVNDALTAQMVADRFGLGVAQLIVKDVLGTSIAHAPRAWIAVRPELSFSKEAGEREWVFETDACEVGVGGSLG